MPKTAHDVMQRSVISLSPEDSLLDAHRIFVEEEIHGAPVVDEEGSIVGVLTSTDLLRAVSQEHESAGFASDPTFRGDALEFGPPIWTVPEDFQDRLANLRVSDVMTDGACTVEETERVRKVADLMCSQRIHRVWVVKAGVPTGVVAALDLLPLVNDE
jgi:predicted transcriptional regulator